MDGLGVHDVNFPKNQFLKIMLKKIWLTVEIKFCDFISQNQNNTNKNLPSVYRVNTYLRLTAHPNNPREASAISHALANPDGWFPTRKKVSFLPLSKA